MRFVNYVRDAERASPINRAAARVLLSCVLLWKVLSYDWGEIAEWPSAAYTTLWYFFPEASARVLPVEALIASAALVCVAVGYRLRATTFLAALLLSHMAGVRLALNASGGTEAFFVATYLLVLFGLYAGESTLSLDAVRRTGRIPLEDLNTHLKSGRDGGYRMDPLRWGLLAIALLYFWAGLAKAVHGPIHVWATAETLSRFILFENPMNRDPLPLKTLLLGHGALLAASAWGTILLECGLLVAVLVGVGVTPAILGLVGMHVVIAFGMGPFFLDNILFLSLFAPWDRLYALAARDESIDLVYDEHCYFCARSLYLVKELDAADSISFYSQYDAPAAYADRPNVDFEEAMYVFDGERAYRGYYAFRRVLETNRLFAPAYWFTRLPPIEYVGVRAYRYIADNRSRHFACAIDD